MKIMQLLYRIKNTYGEELDTLVEGNEEADTTIVFVHGFGTQKDESYGYFTDIAKALYSTYRTVRFDFSGYGKSQGKQEDSDFKKQAGELKTVLDWVKKQFGGRIYVIAQSIGVFITAFLCPEGIGKIVFTSIPNTNTTHIIESSNSSGNILHQGQGRYLMRLESAYCPVQLESCRK